MEGTLTEYVCAHCGEINETFVDPSAGERQSYVEDCSVCCRPNLLTVRIDPVAGSVHLEARNDG